MGIPENQFIIIWQAIKFRMGKKGWSPAYLAELAHYPQYRIEKGIKGGSEWITSDFVHDCVWAFREGRAQQPPDTWPGDRSP